MNIPPMTKERFARVMDGVYKNEDTYGNWSVDIISSAGEVAVYACAITTLFLGTLHSLSAFLAISPKVIKFTAFILTSSGIIAATAGTVILGYFVLSVCQVVRRLLSISKKN